MTPNQKAFQVIKEKAERWVEKGEKLGISFDDTVQEFLEQPDRITKQMLKKLEKEMNKPRWQFFEKYGTDIETGEPYKKPTKEKPKAPEDNSTNFREESTKNANDNIGVEFEDFFEKASFYIDNIIAELSNQPSNADIVAVIAAELKAFLISAEDEDCERFCKNYEENKALIEACFIPIMYESKDYNLVWNACTELFDYLFEGTYFKPDKEKVETEIELIKEYRRRRRYR